MQHKSRYNNNIIVWIIHLANILNDILWIAIISLVSYKRYFHALLFLWLFLFAINAAIMILFDDKVMWYR